MFPRLTVVQISGSIYIIKFRCSLRTTGRTHTQEKVGKRNKLKNKKKAGQKWGVNKKYRKLRIGRKNEKNNQRNRDEKNNKKGKEEEVSNLILYSYLSHSYTDCVWMLHRRIAFISVSTTSVFTDCLRSNGKKVKDENCTLVHKQKSPSQHGSWNEPFARYCTSCAKIRHWLVCLYARSFRPFLLSQWSETE
jgi:hypothetical protein